MRPLMPSTSTSLPTLRRQWRGSVRSAATISRRSALGLGLLAVAACKKGSSPSAPRVDPDSSALADARASELAVLAAATDPAERALHTQHLTALGGSTLGSPTSP